MRTFEERREAVFACAATKRRQARTRLLHIVTLMPMLILTLTIAAWPLMSGLWQTEPPAGGQIPPSLSLGIEDHPNYDVEEEATDHTADAGAPQPDETKGQTGSPADDAPSLEEPSYPSLPLSLTVSITDESGRVNAVFEGTTAEQIYARIQLATEVAGRPDRDPSLDVTPILTLMVNAAGEERAYVLFCDTLREGDRYYVLSAEDANALWTLLTINGS